jgi:hypothetical protein
MSPPVTRLVRAARLPTRPKAALAPRAAAAALPLAAIATHLRTGQRVVLTHHRTLASAYVTRPYSTKPDSDTSPPARPVDAAIFATGLDKYQHATLDYLYAPASAPNAEESRAPQPRALPAPPEPMRAFVDMLALGASHVAGACQASSLLTSDSEGDECGDVSFWLAGDVLDAAGGADGFDERTVLQVLGLAGWAPADDAKVRRTASASFLFIFAWPRPTRAQIACLELDAATRLPKGIAASIESAQLDKDSQEMHAVLIKQLKALDDIRHFAVSGPDGRALHVLLGRMHVPKRSVDGWVGLLGLSIKSDDSSSGSFMGMIIAASLFDLF